MAGFLREIQLALKETVHLVRNANNHQTQLLPFKERA